MKEWQYNKQEIHVIMDGMLELPHLPHPVDCMLELSNLSIPMGYMF